MRTESEILNGYEAGDTDVVFCENFFFILVRITGLGTRIRSDYSKLIAGIAAVCPEAIENARRMDSSVDTARALSLLQKNKGKEAAVQVYSDSLVMVTRDSDFSEPAMYIGLPILKGHPKNGAMLSYQNLADNPIIGTVVRAFSKNDEVWGVAKIFDISLLNKMKTLKSTSPAIVSSWIFDNKHGIIPEAKESPVYLNHLAFVEKGFWDTDDSKGYVANGYKINQEDSVVIEKEPAGRDDSANADDAKKTSDSDPAISNACDSDPAIPNVSPAVSATAKETDDSDSAIPNEAELRAKIESELRESIEKELRAKIEAEAEAKAKAEAEAKAAEEAKRELLDSAEESALDRERWKLIAQFREIADSAHKNVGVKMPYLGSERLNPSATISKILAVNNGLYNPKYAKAIDSAYSEATFELQKDAFQNLIDTIVQKSSEAYSSAQVKDMGFRATQNPNVFVNPNF